VELQVSITRCFSKTIHESFVGIKGDVHLKCTKSNAILIDCVNGRCRDVNGKQRFIQNFKQMDLGFLTKLCSAVKL
jgi:hypothetical protein